jgi:class 3 adenylate cyclase
VETLTFLFTDIEGSTALLRRLGDGVYAQALAGHHALIRSALAAHDGRENDASLDAEINVAVRRSGQAAAACEAAELARRTGAAIAQLRGRLPDEPADRLVQVPGAPWLPTLSDFILTRLVGIVARRIALDYVRPEDTAVAGAAMFRSVSDVRIIMVRDGA